MALAFQEYSPNAGALSVDNPETQAPGVDKGALAVTDKFYRKQGCLLMVGTLMSILGAGWAGAYFQFGDVMFLFFPLFLVMPIKYAMQKAEDKGHLRWLGCCSTFHMCVLLTFCAILLFAWATCGGYLAALGETHNCKDDGSIVFGPDAGKKRDCKSWGQAKWVWEVINGIAGETPGSFINGFFYREIIMGLKPTTAPTAAFLAPKLI